MSFRALRGRAGRLIFAGFAGVELTTELRAIAREFGLGGVVLFARNVESPEQVAEVAYRARTLDRDAPLFVAVDQEGGRVARLRAPFTVWPPMAVLGRAPGVGLARRFAGALARELAAVGITIDFAPVVDVLTNPANPAIGDRALADTAEREAPWVATADYGYLRLRDEGYTDEDLLGWAARVGAEGRWRESFVYFKHEDAGKGPEFAARFIDALPPGAAAPA